MVRVDPGIRWGAVARAVGLLMGLVAGTMLACAPVGLALGSLEGAGHMAVSAGVTALFAGLGLWVGRHAEDRDLGRREALVIVSLCWAALAVFGGLPFVIGAEFTLVDAVFESTSGFTTTGASILPEIQQRLNPPLHLWRALTHWLGGVGVVVLFVAVFPALGVGGKLLFHGEAAGPKSKGLTPRIRETSLGLWKVYTGLTVILVALLMLLGGLGPLEAVIHAFSTMGTGGFSNRNASVGELSGGEGVNALAVEGLLTVFMILAGMNFGLFYAAVRQGPRVILRDAEARAYLWFVAVCIGLAALAILPQKEGVGQALRHAVFMVASVVSTTGFATDDYERWPAFGQLVLLLCYFVGGCAGSTAGGPKVIRLVMLFTAIFTELRRSFRPHLVAPVRVGDAAIAPGALVEAMAVVGLFFATVLGGAFAVALLDRDDAVTALTASLACVANVGPGFGAVGPYDNFSHFTDASKLVLSLCMLLGRLEFITVLALLTPDFRRR